MAESLMLYQEGLSNITQALFQNSF